MWQVIRDAIDLITEHENTATSQYKKAMKLYKKGTMHCLKSSSSSPSPSAKIQQNSFGSKFHIIAQLCSSSREDLLQTSKEVTDTNGDFSHKSTFWSVRSSRLLLHDNLSCTIWLRVSVFVIFDRTAVTWQKCTVWRENGFEQTK